MDKIISICLLTKFQDQLNETKNWSQELSYGEKQLISFARIFLIEPDYIFLDEATSALDEETETEMYLKLKHFSPNTAIISIGHRSSLSKFHKKIITLSSKQEATSFSELTDMA